MDQNQAPSIEGSTPRRHCLPMPRGNHKVWHLESPGGPPGRIGSNCRKSAALWERSQSTLLFGNRNDLRPTPLHGSFEQSCSELSERGSQVQTRAQISVLLLHPPACRLWPRPVSRGCLPGSVALPVHPSSLPPGGGRGRFERTTAMAIIVQK